MKYPTKSKVEKIVEKYSDKNKEEFIGTNFNGVDIDRWEASFRDGMNTAIKIIKKMNKKVSNDTI